MTPKEKAKELVDKFIPYSYFCDGNNSMNRNYQMEENAKQCALIAVDLILETNTFWNKGIEGVTPELTEEYWQSVKQEIEKL